MERNIDAILPIALPSVFHDAPWRCLNVLSVSSPVSFRME